MSDIEKTAKEFIASRSDNAPFLVATPPEYIASGLLEELQKVKQERDELREQVEEREPLAKHYSQLAADMEKENQQLKDQLSKYREVVEALDITYVNGKPIVSVPEFSRFIEALSQLKEKDDE